MLKKIWKIFAGIQIALLVMLLSFTPASAADLRGYDDVIIASGDVVNDDLYLAGNRVVIHGTVNGDVMAAGSTIIIDGVVNGDVLALGSSVTIDGEITGSARVAASSIHFGGNIGEDLVVAGSSIDIQDAAEIGRDLVFGGSNVKVNSIVNGDLLGVGEMIDFADEIGGNAAVDVEDLDIASTAVIKGNLIYTSENEADIESGAVIIGEITRKIPTHDRWYRNWTFPPFVGAWFHFFSYLMVLVVGIIIILVAPNKSKQTVENLMKQPLQSLGWGALVFFVTPIAVVISILIIVGIPAGLIAILLYGFLIFVAQLVIGLFIGQWIVNRLNITESKGSQILALFIGFTLLTLVKLIPFVGFVIWFATVIFGIGAIALLFSRKKKQEVTAEVVEVIQ